MSLVGRRRMLVAAASWLAVPVLGADIPRKIPRIGIVFNSLPLGTVQGEKPAELVMRGFLQGLRESGYTEGENVIIERRSAEGKLERLERIIRDLAELPIDAIVVSGNAATLAAKKVTATIPVVSAGMATPVELGIAASLARPGGNITGLVPAFGRELPMKRLELLREMLPNAKRVVYLGSRPAGELPEEIRSAGARMGLTLVFVDAQLPRIEAGLADLEGQGADALIVAPLTPLYAHQRTIAEFAARVRLPDIYGDQQAVEAGGLASYGIDSYDAWRRAARYVGRILNGTKPGDLPIEQMDRYTLVLNKKRARALGITIPQALLQRADEVIE